MASQQKQFGDIAKSLEDLCVKPDINLTDIATMIRDMNISITQRLTSIETKLSEIDTLRDDVKELRDDFEETKDHVQGLLDAEDMFPSNVSLIVTNLPAEDDEDDTSLLSIIKELIQDGIEVQDVTVRAVQRLKPRTFAEATAGEGTGENTARPRGPGIVKVRLSTVSEKVKCLRNKQKLRAKGDYYRTVYIKNCEDHSSRVSRLNMQTLIEELQYTDRFRFTGSGRLTRLTDDGDGNNGPAARRYPVRDRRAANHGDAGRGHDGHIRGRGRGANQGGIRGGNRGRR